MTWYRAYMDGRNMKKTCDQQVEEYFADV
jgi:hypothetical protein